VGWDTATAREKVRVARALGKLPLIDEAFGCACLSYAKVRALTRVATPQNEGQLLELAMVATAAQLERICRGCRAVLDSENEEEAPRPEERCVHQHRLPGGMVMLELVLEPDEADLVLRAIERAQEAPAEAPEPGEAAVDAPREEPTAAAAGVPAGAESGRWPSRADGAVRLAESYLSGHPVTGNGGERFQVMVHVGQEALAADGQWAATLEDGSRLSAETLRRVACDCGLVAVGGDGEGENLNIGRRSRSIPPALRRALMVRDHGCAFPGCSHTRFLHAHHIEHWLHGGETSLENTVLTCSHHHHLLHEGGWTISRDADGSFLFHSPSGRVLAQNPPREVKKVSLLIKGTDSREWSRYGFNDADLARAITERLARAGIEVAPAAAADIPVLEIDAHVNDQTVNNSYIVYVRLKDRLRLPQNPDGFVTRTVWSDWKLGGFEPHNYRKLRTEILELVDIFANQHLLTR
jgi:hypothetical protein